MLVENKFERNTKQRQVILKELKKLTSHPTAKDLYEIVKKSLPCISLGTVYRNLELLTQNKIIQKLDISGNEARFDGNPAHHYHVRCVVCGRVDDVHNLSIDTLKDVSEDINGYKILGHCLEFHGTCPDCRNNTLINETI